MREKGATVLAVTNVMGSQATRESDAVLYTRAGARMISVANQMMGTLLDIRG